MLHFVERKKEELKLELDKIEDDLKQKETALMDQIPKQNTLFAINGKYNIMLKTWEERRPKWKEAFFAELGEVAAQEVIDNTEPNTGKQLVIN